MLAKILALPSCISTIVKTSPSCLPFLRMLYILVLKLMYISY